MVANLSRPKLTSMLGKTPRYLQLCRCVPAQSSLHQCSGAFGESNRIYGMHINLHFQRTDAIVSVPQTGPPHDCETAQTADCLPGLLEQGCTSRMQAALMNAHHVLMSLQSPTGAASRRQICQASEQPVAHLLARAGRSGHRGRHSLKPKVTSRVPCDGEQRWSGMATEQGWITPTSRQPGAPRRSDTLICPKPESGEQCQQQQHDALP